MSSLEKQCSKCKRVLPVEMFCKKTYSKDGLDHWCRSCHSQKRTRWYNNGGREKCKAYIKANPVQTITAQLTKAARTRAKQKDIPFDLDLDYVRSMVGENAELASHCPVLGMALDWSRQRGNGSKPLPNSPSMDRIDPERGYVKGNIWIISHRANQIKSDASHEELKLVTKAVGEAIVNSLEF